MFAVAFAVSITFPLGTVNVASCLYAPVNTTVVEDLSTVQPANVYPGISSAARVTVAPNLTL